jgi:hypothetical protein
MADPKDSNSKGKTLLWVAGIVLFAMTAVAQNATDKWRPAQVIPPANGREPPATIFIDLRWQAPLLPGALRLSILCAEPASRAGVRP